MRTLGVDDTYFKGLQEESDSFAVDVRSACKALVADDPSSMFSNVYADAHGALAAEREQYLAFRALLETTEPV
jgi:hypothetical protein